MLAAGLEDRVGASLVQVGGLEELRAEWDGVAGRSANVFATWDWIATWWRHFGRDRPLLLYASRDAAGGLRAILPLYVATGAPSRVVRFIGHGASDQLGPICDERDRALAARLLERALDTHGGWDLFLGDDLPVDAAWRRQLRSDTVCRTESPTVWIGGTSWEEYLGSRSRNLRGQVRGRERRLARTYKLRHRLADDPNRIQADMATLVSLHQARWRRAGGSSSFGDGLRRFHAEFAAHALRRGWLRLRFLELNDRVVAALLAFRFGRIEWYYQAGRDPAFERQAVGFVLLVHSLREAFEDGLQEYRLLRGAEPYKARFANGAADVETVAHARTRAGRLMLGGLVSGRRLPRPLRRRLPASLRVCDGAPGCERSSP
jgi:CelD/BcsL family acetyltransferase involved in cellulose biosynthesis